MCVCVCAQSRLTVTPWTVNRHAPLSMEFSRQECWSGLPSPSPGDLPDSGIELTSLASPALTGGFFHNFCGLAPILIIMFFKKAQDYTKMSVCASRVL